MVLQVAIGVAGGAPAEIRISDLIRGEANLIPTMAHASGSARITWPCLFCILLWNWVGMWVGFFDFLEKWIPGKLFFLLVDVFYVIGFGTRMVSGAFSNFEIEN